MKAAVIVRTVGGPHLADALASLCAQTERDFEVVVVDMSGGAHAATLEHFASRLRLRVMTSPRVSRPKALNLGIAAATAPFITILDDDNLYDAGHLATLLRGDAAYVYTGVRHGTYTAEGERVASREAATPFAFEDLLRANFIYATGSCYRKELWQRLGGYDERFEVFEDWDFLIRAAQQEPIEFLGVVSGESRKFTGRPGTSSFEAEVARVRRCHAGIYWKHRRLLFARGERPKSLAAYAEHCALRTPARRGLLAKRVRGLRLELVADLAAWFVHNLRHGSRSR